MSSSAAPPTGQVIIDRTSNYSVPDVLNQLIPTALKDVNIDFTRKESVIQNYEILILYGFDAINNMILNVLYTELGERDFEPTFGSRALNLIHEPNDSIIPSQVEIELYDRIRYWVPYIDIFLSGIIITPYYGQQLIEITFVYTELVSNIRNTFTTYLSNRAKLLKGGS
jgi:phage baseplate assembly protein W